jgi:hypothetical protein
MPSDLTAWFGNKILRWINGNAMPTAPSSLYLAAFNGNPKTSGTEIGAQIKAAGPRQVVTFASLAAGVAHLLTSNVAVDWGNSENATSLSHIALFDAASSGNMIASKAVSGGPISILVNSAVKFNSGAVTFNIGSDT